jgi:uncharacterized protein
LKILNKTVQYRLKASDQNGRMEVIDDSADVSLPSIEKLTDTIKGAGIMGEIDLPTHGQVGAMSLAVNFRADNPKYAMLSRPGEIKLEVVRVVDVFDSSQIKTGIQQHKVFITGINKVYNPGTVDVNASADGSVEFEVLQYRKVVDGREVLNIDKLNFKYVVNGVDYMAQLRSALQ